MTANHHHLLWMRDARHADFHIDRRHSSWSPNPPLYREGVAPHLCPKPLQIVHDFLCPIRGELVMFVERGREVVIIACLAPQEMRYHIKKLVIDIRRVNSRKRW